MAGDIDFGSSATRSDERRVQPSFFDSIVFAVEINLTSVSPEGATDRQEFPGACVPLVVREKITVAVLLRLRAARDDVQGDAPADECGESIDLLYESRRLHKARAVGDDELELRRRPANRTRDKNSVRLVTAERKQHRFDSRFLRAACKSNPTLHVRQRGWRSAFGREHAGRFLGRLHAHFAAFGKHPVESQIHRCILLTLAARPP